MHYFASKNRAVNRTALAVRERIPCTDRFYESLRPKVQEPNKESVVNEGVEHESFVKVMTET